MDKGQNIIGNICQYGNLHLGTLNEGTDQLIRAFVDESKLIHLDSNSCFNQFGKASAIGGRSIHV